MGDDRRFPIQGDRITRRGRYERIPATSVPWAEAEIAYRTYSHLFGTSQSLERLAERGGFGRAEFAVFRAGLNFVRDNALEVVLDVPLVTEPPAPEEESR